MKQYHLNKKEILYWAKRCRSFLNLPKIDIKIYKWDIVGLIEDRPAFLPSVPRIEVVQLIESLLLKPSSLKDLEFTDYTKERIIFSIFHEFAHYFQWYHYNKWFERFTDKEHYIYFEGKHWEKKAERNADKIASILFTRLYKNKTLTTVK